MAGAVSNYVHNNNSSHLNLPNIRACAYRNKQDQDGYVGKLTDSTIGRFQLKICLAEWQPLSYSQLRADCEFYVIGRYNLQKWSPIFCRDSLCKYDFCSDYLLAFDFVSAL